MASIIAAVAQVKDELANYLSPDFIEQCMDEHGHRWRLSLSRGRFMHHRAGFHLVDMLVAVTVAMAAAFFLIVAWLPQRPSPNPMICATRLNGVYKAMSLYSLANREKFPLAGASDPDVAAVGFVDRNRPVRPSLGNSVTAPLWAIVRDGTTSPKNFVRVEPPAQAGGFAGDTLRLARAAAAELGAARERGHHAPQAGPPGTQRTARATLRR